MGAHQLFIGFPILSVLDNLAFVSCNSSTVNASHGSVAIAKPARSGVGVEVASAAKLQAQEALNFVPEGHLFSI
jgi:hypothetical protein